MASETIFRLFQKGHFYDFTVYTDPRTGRPVFRQRYNSKGKGIRYLDQQINRGKVGLIANSYRELMPFVGETFTDKKERQSNYNAFFAANFSNITTYVPRSEARKGGAILQELVISQGPLESIGYQLNTARTKVVSNIRLNGLTAITAQTTIGEFSRALTPKGSVLKVGRTVIDTDRQSSLEQWLEGDELYFWRLVQDFEQAPTIHAERRMVLLSNNDDRTLWSQTGQDGFTVEHTTVNGVEGYYLACQVVEETSVAWSHSRRGDPKLKDPKDRVLTSTQKTLGESSLVALYSTEQALLKMLESYGGVNRVNYSAPTDNNGAYDRSQGLSPEEGGTGNTGPTAQQVTVTASVNGGGGTVSPASRTVAQGTSVTFTATPNAGKRVREWSTGATGNSITVVASANRSITVTFEDIPGGSGGGGGEIE